MTDAAEAALFIFALALLIWNAWRGDAPRPYDWNEEGL